MCGGVTFPYKKEYKEALEKYYSPAEVEEFERTGQVRHAAPKSTWTRSSTPRAQQTPGGSGSGSGVELCEERQDLWSHEVA